jgi:uncharacterized pyridoxal phosphate-containing UPF0001 family protein
MATPLVSNLGAVRGRIEAAARRAGRDPGGVTLVGISKTMPAERVREAIDAGLRDVGENKVQEARDKAPLVGPGARWHLVGHLQGNKANLAARLFDVVHSLDSVEILARLESGAAAAGRSITPWCRPTGVRGDEVGCAARGDDAIRRRPPVARR